MFGAWPYAIASLEADTNSPANLNQQTHTGGARFDYIFLSNNATGWSLLNMTIQSLYPVSDHSAVRVTLEFR